jgi:hypothetical protein
VDERHAGPVLPKELSAGGEKGPALVSTT